MDMKMAVVREMYHGSCSSSVLHPHTSIQIFILCCDDLCDLCVFPVSLQQVVRRVHLQRAERHSLAVWHSWNHEGVRCESLLYSIYTLCIQWPTSCQFSCCPSLCLCVRSWVWWQNRKWCQWFRLKPSSRVHLCWSPVRPCLWELWRGLTSCRWWLFILFPFNEQRERLYSFISTVS